MSTPKLTPMLKQYLSIKDLHQDKIVLFRMGDFYETFFDDASKCSKILGITLTSRNKKNDKAVPLAGFPHHALKFYLNKLIAAGQRVVICEQMEDPKQTKDIVKREVVDIVTPGTILDYNFIQGVANNFLSAVFEKDEFFGLASLDISTSDFVFTQLLFEQLASELARLSPKEILFVSGATCKKLEKLNLEFSPVLTKHYQNDFDSSLAEDILCSHFEDFCRTDFSIKGKSVGLVAAALALDYLKKIKNDSLDHIRSMQFYSLNNFMGLDEFTISNLELLCSLATKKRSGSLISVLDKTKTPMGSRLLTSWLTKPLVKKQTIQQRHKIVQQMVDRITETLTTQEILGQIGDLSRLISKISTLKINPKEVLSLSFFLESQEAISETLTKYDLAEIEKLNNQISDFSAVVQKIRGSILPNPNMLLTDGNIINNGYSNELDQLRKTSREGKGWIAKLETKERKRTTIPSLKIKYNRVFGYFIEITNLHLAKVPPDYSKKQTLSNCERFISPELKELEQKVLGAEQRIKSLEYELFVDIRSYLKTQIRPMLAFCSVIAQLDVYSNFALVAHFNRYTCPEFNSQRLVDVKNSRHPVVEHFTQTEQFIANDIYLNDSNEKIIILTGPNMAGKSTYLRQIAIISIMAQIGSFVPADSADLPIFDKIFTRVGASDNLAQGHSTFLVEMLETAQILKNATVDSLIILDEVGRGTSTFDGLSLAWAIVEYIHNQPNLSSKTLFATHYHELTELSELLFGVQNCNFAVRKKGESMIFLRKIQRGKARKSYGIEVAALAGLPNKVVKRAQAILKNLNETELSPFGLVQKAKAEKDISQLDILDSIDTLSSGERQVLEDIKSFIPDQITPIQALVKLAELKRLLED